jgi:hypothetical protein
MTRSLPITGPDASRPVVMWTMSAAAGSTIGVPGELYSARPGAARRAGPVVTSLEPGLVPRLRPGLDLARALPIAGAPRFPFYSILERGSTDFGRPVDNSVVRLSNSMGPSRGGHSSLGDSSSVGRSSLVRSRSSARR